MSWFKRSEKGIQTRTEEKKTSQKGCGIRLPLVKLLKHKNLQRISMLALKTNTTLELAVKNTLKSCLMTIILKNSTLKLFQKTFKIYRL